MAPDVEEKDEIISKLYRHSALLIPICQKLSTLTGKE